MRGGQTRGRLTSRDAGEAAVEVVEAVEAVEAAAVVMVLAEVVLVFEVDGRAAERSV